MDIERGNVAGFLLTGESRTGEPGTWSSATAPGGRQAGALRLDPRFTSDPAARERLVAAVLAERALIQAGLTGLVPVTDLVSAGREVWLLTGEAVSPTLADLLVVPAGAPGPGAGEAAVVLLETARTLLALHAAGLAHGALRPDTVVISADGSALLAERGLADALHGRPAHPGRDAAAWAALARGLAANWGAADPGAAALFERAAAVADADGLGRARDVLLSGQDTLPAGSLTRNGLAQAVRLRPAPGLLPANVPPVPVPDEGEVVTLLRADVPTAAQENVVMRFGPGVPPETTAAQIWRAGRDRQRTEQPSDGLRALGTAARRRRRRTALATVVLALMVVGVLAVWLLRGSATPLAVTGVEVSAPKKQQACDATVRITGVFATNGSGGEIRYEWRRSDRKTPIEQTDTVPSGAASHEVSLEWTVKGEGRFRGTATLRLLSPLAGGQKVQDKASFTYKCP
ncbi:hypothetical protein [Streptosporangium sp. NPDC049376]|uniref:hypothetical protein n=1 Tax=Streptosporangium sp. NPDC049376 TaxID=3366192 RepID=UPI00379146E2